MAHFTGTSLLAALHLAYVKLRTILEAIADKFDSGNYPPNASQMMPVRACAYAPVRVGPAAPVSRRRVRL